MEERTSDMKKVMVLLLAMTVIMVGATGICFAGGRDSPAGSGTTASLKLTMPATSDLDVVIGQSTSVSLSDPELLAQVLSNEITMKGSEGASVLTINNLVVKNMSEIGKIKLIDLVAKGVNGWEIVPDTTDFETLEKDAKMFSMVADGEFDMVNTYTNINKDVCPQSIGKITLVGKVGAFNQDIKETVGELTLTIGLA
jgi:hypothetical protein